MDIIEKEIITMYNCYIVTKKRSAGATDDNNDDNFDIDRSNHWKLTTSVIYSLCVWCCPNWALLLPIIVYMFHAKKTFDEQSIGKMHHTLKRICNNSLKFGTKISSDQIMHFDKESLMLFAGDSNCADVFLSEYDIYADKVSGNSYLKEMLEELHWCFNKVIEKIEDFKNSSFGYIRPDVIASIVVFDGFTLSYEINVGLVGEIQVNIIGINMLRLTDLSLKYKFFHPIINNYLQESPEDAKKVIMLKCLTKENILRAVLLREKILKCKIEYDDQGNPLSAEQNIDEVHLDCLANRQDFKIIKHHIYLISVANNYLLLRPQRWLIFYWTAADKTIIYNGNRITGNNHFADNNSFDLLLSVVVELGGVFPKEYRIEVDGVDVPISQWLFNEHQQFRNNCLKEESLIKFRKSALAHTFQDSKTSFCDAHWLHMYNLVKSIDLERQVKSQEMVNFNGKDYAIGKWIQTNRTAFKDNQIKPDRLSLLRELKHEGQRFHTVNLVNLDDHWLHMYNLVKSIDLDRKVKFNEIVNFNGKDYAIGKWIQYNRTAFKDNKIKPDRLSLLRELKHEGQRFISLDTSKQT